jgi:catechol 2,3-dioxygenase-like lactoylglutathione lyase family enzyme
MLSSIRNLDYVILLCGDVDAMKYFYHTILGFPIHRELKDWVEMNVGSSLLTLRPRGRAYDGKKLANSAGVQLAFQVAADEVEPCHRELREKQVEILESPQDWSYGHRTLFFRDPEGNVLEIYAEIQD